MKNKIDKALQYKYFYTEEDFNLMLIFEKVNIFPNYKQEEFFMALITNMLIRSGLVRSAQYALVNVSSNKISIRTFSSPGDILKPEDPEYKYLSKNLEKFRSSGTLTYLSPEQISFPPKEEIETLKGIFQDLSKQNRELFHEVRSLVAKVEKLTAALEGPNQGTLKN